MSTTLRLFFGIDLETPWPEDWPRGRVLEEADRHLTLAFLGEVEGAAVERLVDQHPVPSCLFAPTGWFDRCVFLPNDQTARVAAWHLAWDDPTISLFQKTLLKWLLDFGFLVSQKPWLSHVTVCRNPVDLKAWAQMFEPLPCYAKAFHLFQSLGSSHYRSLCSKPFLAPFQEIEHTADMAFLVKGTDLFSLYDHAVLALSFKCPPFFRSIKKPLALSSLEDVVIALNGDLSRADRAVGCPFKAVSFHGEIKPLNHPLIEWEMIVDV